MSTNTSDSHVGKASKRDWIAVYAMMLGAFMAILDIQIINASLANIQSSLSATLTEGSWISTSYMIAEIVIIPLSGWLATVFSMRRYLIWSTAGFILFSMLCGLAWNLNSMILFRALQGIAVAPLIPLSLTMARSRLPEEDQPKAMTIFSFVIVFAPSIGPSLGGWLTENYSWHLIFYLNLLPGLLMIYLLRYSLDKEPMQLDKLRNADWAGIITLSIGLATMEFFLEEGNRNNWFDSYEIILTAMVSAISLMMFVYFQLTRSNPVLNLRIFKDRQFFLGCVVNSSLGITLTGTVYLLPLYLSQVQNYSPLQAGEVMLWGGLPQLLVIPMVPLLLKFVDKRLLSLIGITLFFYSVWLNSHMSIDYSGEQFRWSLFIRSVGQPFIMVPLTIMATSKLKLADVPSGSSLFNTTRNLSAAVGVAVVSTIIDRRNTFHQLRISEQVSLSNNNVQQFLGEMQAFLPQLSVEQDSALLMNVIYRDALIMAFNDAFTVVAAALAIGVVALLGMKSDKKAEASYQEKTA